MEEFGRNQRTETKIFSGITKWIGTRKEGTEMEKGNNQHDLNEMFNVQASAVLTEQSCPPEEVIPKS